MTWISRRGYVGSDSNSIAPRFKRTMSTPEVLLTLTDGDLRDLGVASLGHRKRMLAAIAALGMATHTPDDSNGGVRAPEKTVSAQREAALQPVHAERRRLTIMFVDLVGSTALSSVL